MGKIIYKCPYKAISCTKYNTATNTLDVTCVNCENYDKGVKETGSTPLLDWFINLFKK